MGGTGNFDRHCVFGVIFNLGNIRLIIKGGDFADRKFFARLHRFG